MASTSRSARNQSLSFQPLAKRLKAWRAEGSRGKRIPEELWKAAAELARVQGLNRTATELKLNYYDLQRRLAEIQRIRIRPRPKPAPHFVEVVATNWLSAIR